MPYTTPVDIANLAVGQCGDYHINNFQEVTDAALRANDCYDVERLQELERHTWRFAIRRARVRAVTQSTQLVTFPTYNPSTTYTIGQVVLYAGGTYLNATVYPWILNAPTATGLEPDTAPQWGHYFGPLTADLFDNQSLYDAGELCIVPELWTIGATYPQYAILQASDGVFYVSQQAANIGHQPANGANPLWWTPWVVPQNQIINPGGPSSPLYVIFTSDNGGPTVFLSLTSGNGPLSASQVIPLPGANPLNWTQLPGATVEQLSVIWPTDAGPANDPQTQNLFWLPFGFLRPAPSDPKEDRITWLGAPTGPLPNDFVFESSYMLSRSPYPLTLRFVADIADVTRMNALFCKCVAGGMAKWMSTPLKANETQMARIERQVLMAVREARMVDAIFQEAVSPELDDFLTCRY